MDVFLDTLSLVGIGNTMLRLGLVGVTGFGIAM